MSIASKVSIPPERRGLKLLFTIRRDLLGYFVRLMRQEGAYAWFSLGGRNVLMLNDATGIEHVFRNAFQNYHKSYFYKVLKPLLGNSLLLTDGDIWKKQRKESSPPFANKNFDEMSQQMVAATQAMMHRWEPRIAKGEALDLNFETMWFTLDVLLRALFHEAKDGIAFNMQRAVTILLREAEERVWAPISVPQWLIFKTPKYSNALGFLKKTLNALIDAHRENDTYPEDLLSRLIASYGTSPQQQAYLRDQVMTFLIAGHETTANGIVWACHYLSQRPEIWKKIQQEVDDVLGTKAPGLNDIKNLSYTRQVFDEILRINPTVWTLSRDVMVDDQIPLDNGTALPVKEGDVIMLCTYAVHRRELYWENPEVFDPDRFSPEAIARRPAFAYFPFGGGQRQCLGMRFAQIESVIALAMMAQRYDVSLLPGQNIKPMPFITLRPNGPVFFRLKKRISILLATEKASKIEKNLGATAHSKCPMHKIAR